MPKETITRFDAADYLDNEEVIAEFLAAAAAEADPAFFVSALGDVARARNMTKVAQAAGITRAGLYKVFEDGANPSYATVAKIAKALGFDMTAKPTVKAAPAKKARSTRAGAAARG